MKKKLNFKVDDETYKDFMKIQERDSINISDLMRKLLKRWIKEHK